MQKTSFIWMLCGVIALNGLLPDRAMAQSVNPGSFLNRLQSPLDKKAISGFDAGRQREAQEDLREPTVSRPNVDAPDSQVPDSLATPIQVSRIEIEGNTVLSQKELRRIVEPFENKETPFNTLQRKLLGQLTAAYVDKGYVTSRASIQPQTLKDGVLVITMVEGTVNDLQFEEDQLFKSRAVLPTISQKPGTVLNLNKLLRDIRRVNENPDINLEAKFKNVAEDKTNVVLSNNSDAKHTLHLTPFVDNLGVTSTGEIRSGFTLTHNNLLGFRDTIFSNHAWSREAYTVVNGYEVPVGHYGTRLGFTQSFSVFDFQNSGARFKGYSNQVLPYIKQDLIRKQGLKVEAEVGFGIKNSKLLFNGTPNSEDKLRVATQAITVEQQDRSGFTFMRHELAEGFDLFGATLGSDPEFNRAATPSRPEGGSQFLRYTGNIVRVQRMLGGSYTTFKLGGQYSPDQLSSIEQFQTGGTSTVRGYTEGRLLGDSGFFASAEYHLPLSFLPVSLRVPFTGTRLKDTLEVIGFVEGGGVFDNDVRIAGSPGVNPASGEVVSNAYMLSVGTGLRARLNSRLNARFDVGFPLIRLEGNSERARVHFGLESQLF